MTTAPPEQDLVARLRELAEATKNAEPSAHLEARLIEAFGESRLTPPARMQVRWFPAIAASAVLATVVAVLVLQVRDVPQRVHTVATVPFEGSQPAALVGFVPIPGAAALPQLESASIVRYELPLTTLPAYGVDIVPDAARRTVEADLLIGQDGYARAIRIVAEATP